MANSNKIFGRIVLFFNKSITVVLPEPVGPTTIDVCLVSIVSCNYITLSTIHNEVRNYMNLPSNLLRIKDYIKYMKLFLPKNISMKVISKNKIGS
jgi:hypothetical protein